MLFVHLKFCLVEPSINPPLLSDSAAFRTSVATSTTTSDPASLWAGQILHDLY